MMKKILLAVLALAAAAPVAAAQPADAPVEQEASIPFFRYSRLASFTPIDDDTVYLRSGGRWYRAELFGPCFNLPWATSIGVDTRGSSSLDRFSTLIVGGDRCRIESLVRSEAPPRRQRQRR
jgi:hypothetical protein